MKRGSIQPYGTSAWQSKAVLKKLRFTRFRTAPGPWGPPKIRFFARRRGGLTQLMADAHVRQRVRIVPKTIPLGRALAHGALDP